MDFYEVTNAQYKSCVDMRVCSAPSRISSIRQFWYYGNPDYDNYPVIYVNWDQARTYCEWQGKRLPTEAEWEYAARGGLSGKRYPWGDDGPVCTAGTVNGTQSSSCHPQDTIEAGSFAANGYGLYDMAGNVWEWVNDRYDSGYYQYCKDNNIKDDPQGPSSGNNRVIRGGGWGSSNLDLRLAARNDNSPANQGNSIGFRCAQ
jgi:formylglycine-generating enzyme required for sulfatase activity